MSTPTNQTQLKDPHEKSFAAFLNYIVREALADVPPPLWIGPVDTSRLDPEIAGYFARHNPSLETFEQVLSQSVRDDLALLGVPAASLDKIDGEKRQALERLLGGARALQMVAEEHLAELPSKTFKTEQLAVAGLCHTLRRDMPGASTNAIHEAVATELNDGIPKHELNAFGFTRFHVLRGQRAYLEALRIKGKLKDKEEALQLCGLMAVTHGDLVRSVRYLYQSAKQNKAFAGLRGVELAKTICEQRDIYSCLEKADRFLKSQRRAA